MKATDGSGSLVEIPNCWIMIPGAGTVFMKALPDISDSKSAQYNDETVIGRASPLKTYSHSAPRTISMTLHFYTTKAGDADENLSFLRALESAVYPRDIGGGGAPFIPPPVCMIRCGSLLSDKDPLCVILMQYSVKFPTNVAWNKTLFTPVQFDVDTTWEVVYKSADLPGQSRIFTDGR
ncbi:MAG: hypothetical protein M0R80_08775 [Proteobacteria bacterium]|jgi:hypothetical protein|nr:hypothetical protein [Pseudomonadota bacterium]